MELHFRNLRPDEVEVRIQRLTDAGAQLLLYKNARVDMSLLDETVGAMNWQRSHSRDNANCTVSIWDADKAEWVKKEDTGTESSTEAEKGLASDSFKRACTNWGIGQELYTAPYIWVPATLLNIKKDSHGKTVCYDRFSVTDMVVTDGRITDLTIVNPTTGVVVFTQSAPASTAPAVPAAHSSAHTPASAVVIPFGGYAGKTLDEVFKSGGRPAIADIYRRTQDEGLRTAITQFMLTRQGEQSSEASA